MKKTRALQVAATIRRELQPILARGFADPRIRGLVTLTRVELSPDLARAVAYVSVMPAQHTELTMHGLRAATKRVRAQLMRRIHLREMPVLQFKLDEGLRNQHEVMQLLGRLRDEEADRADDPAPAGDRPRPNEGPTE